jgi:hypothetical protein
MLISLRALRLGVGVPENKFSYLCVGTYHSKLPEILTAFGRNISMTVRHASDLQEIGLDR